MVVTLYDLTSYGNLNGLAIDSSGNLYVAALLQNTVLKIAPSGKITTFTGFADPEALTIDASGNLYVVNFGTSSILKVSPAGTITTFAGGAGIGYPPINGTGPAASFDSPFGVAADGKGNIFVAEYGDDWVRKITPAGVVSTFAKIGLGSTPYGIAADVSGNLFLTDLIDKRIVKIAADGTVSNFITIKSLGANVNSATSLQELFGIAVDRSGTVYATDPYDFSVLMITPDGKVTGINTTNLNYSSDGVLSKAIFTKPYGITTDASGNVYITDGNLIREITFK